MAETKRVVLIMAGGSGTRFWPLSTPDLPKQYLPLAGQRSLIQQTIDRLLPFVGAPQIHICSTKRQEALLKKQLPDIKNLIFEPIGRNTAACVMLSVAHLLRTGTSKDTVIFVFSADSFIGDQKAFLNVLAQAEKTAREENALVTFGVVPTFAHTGYGYVEAKHPSQVSAVARFLEKPDLKTAEKLIASKNVYWNAGMFAWTLGNIVAAFEKFCGPTWNSVSAAKTETEIAAVYETLPSVPIDKAVLEKAENVWVVPCEIDWSDVGSWNSLFELHSKDPNANVAHGGKTTWLNSTHCLVSAPAGKEVAVIGVKDIIVVDQGDKLLIVHKDSDQLVKEVVKPH